MRRFIACVPILVGILGFQPSFAEAGHRPCLSRQSFSVPYGPAAVSPRWQFGLSAPSVLPTGNSHFGHAGHGHAVHRSVGLAPQQIEAAVREYYLAYLGREPEPAGYFNWVNFVLNGASLSELNVGILSSAECFTRNHNDPGQYVAFIFRHAAGREATPKEVFTWANLFYQRYHGDATAFCRDLLISLGAY